MTGDGALRFALARDVDLVAVSPGPPRPDALPARVRLVDLATAGELAELAEPAEPRTPAELDGLVAEAEARRDSARTARSPR